MNDKCHTKSHTVYPAVNVLWYSTWVRNRRPDSGGSLFLGHLTLYKGLDLTICRPQDSGIPEAYQK